MPNPILAAGPAPCEVAGLDLQMRSAIENAGSGPELGTDSFRGDVDCKADLFYAQMQDRRNLCVIAEFLSSFAGFYFSIDVP